MKLCVNCEIDYPEKLVHPFLNHGEYTNLCAICALQWVNAIHKTRLKRFHGEQAEALRQAAIAYRRTLKEDR